MSDALLRTLHARFDAHAHRHPGVVWADVEARLSDHAGALAALRAMEATGGEPDVIGAAESGRFTFMDCSPESPTGRRSLCYDAAALDSRKENKPAGSAIAMAADMGITLLSEAQYRLLQSLSACDLKTSSWVQTPPAIRALGGALFCDCRYATVFVYHNGASSYFGARGFRGALVV